MRANRRVSKAIKHSLCFTCKLRLFTQEPLRGHSPGPLSAADVGEDPAIHPTPREEVSCMMLPGSHWTGNLMGGQAQSRGTDWDVWCYGSSFHNASQRPRKLLSHLLQMFPTWGISDTIRNQGFSRMPKGKGFSCTRKIWLLSKTHELVGTHSTASSLLVKGLCRVHDDTVQFSPQYM